MNTITLDNVKRGQRVILNIAAARPIRLLSGVLHEDGQEYTVLGTHGTLIRLSRVSDRQKLIIDAQSLSPKRPTIREPKENPYLVTTPSGRTFVGNAD